MSMQVKMILNFMFQSNIEGELVDQIQNSRNNQDGLIINAGDILIHLWLFTMP